MQSLWNAVYEFLSEELLGLFLNKEQHIASNEVSESGINIK